MITVRFLYCNCCRRQTRHSYRGARSLVSSAPTTANQVADLYVCDMCTNSKVVDSTAETSKE